MSGGIPRLAASVTATSRGSGCWRRTVSTISLPRQQKQVQQQQQQQQQRAIHVSSLASSSSSVGVVIHQTKTKNENVSMVPNSRSIHSTSSVWQSSSSRNSQGPKSSSSSSSSSSSVRSSAQVWRQMVKPFLLKCHPDVMASLRPETVRNTSDAFSVIQKTNLAAIQNLNNYLDTMQTLLDRVAEHDLARRLRQQQSSSSQSPPISIPKLSSPIVLVDFILLVEDMGAKVKKNQDYPIIMSRRKVELAYPTKEWLQDATVEQLRRQAMGQLIQLLKVAGLEIPQDIIHEMMKAERAKYMSEQERQETESSSHPNSEDSDVFSRRRYLANKRAFWDMIDLEKLDTMTKEAMEDIQAHVATLNLYSKNESLRQWAIANILARVQVQRYGNHDHLAAPPSLSSDGTQLPAGAEPLISIKDELIAFRRLSLLMEDHFEELELEDWGSAWWERLQIVLMPERPYNTSSSALHKRTKLRAGDNGFSLTFHAKWQDGATMTIPIDFRDDELLSEFKRNLHDYQVMVGDGLEQCLKNPDDPMARKLLDVSWAQHIDPF